MSSFVSSCKASDPESSVLQDLLLSAIRLEAKDEFILSTFSSHGYEWIERVTTATYIVNVLTDEGYDLSRGKKSSCFFIDKCDETKYKQAKAEEDARRATLLERYRPVLIRSIVEILKQIPVISNQLLFSQPWITQLEDLLEALIRLDSDWRHFIDCLVRSDILIGMMNMCEFMQHVPRFAQKAAQRYFKRPSFWPDIHMHCVDPLLNSIKVRENDGFKNNKAFQAKVDNILKNFHVDSLILYAFRMGCSEYGVQYHLACKALKWFDRARAAGLITSELKVLQKLKAKRALQKEKENENENEKEKEKENEMNEEKEEKEEERDEKEMEVEKEAEEVATNEETEARLAKFCDFELRQPHMIQSIMNLLLEINIKDYYDAKDNSSFLKLKSAGIYNPENLMLNLLDLDADFDRFIDRLVNVGMIGKEEKFEEFILRHTSFAIKISKHFEQHKQATTVLERCIQPLIVDLQTEDEETQKRKAKGNEKGQQKEKCSERKSKKSKSTSWWPF